MSGMSPSRVIGSKSVSGLGGLSMSTKRSTLSGCATVKAVATSPHGMSNDDRTRDAEFIEHRHDQRRLPGNRIAGARRVRAAVTDQIEPDHLVAARQLWGDVVRPIERGPEAVDQNGRRAISLHLDIGGDD